MAQHIIVKNEEAKRFLDRLSISGAEVVKLFIVEGQQGKMLVADMVTKDAARQMRVAVACKADGEVEAFSVPVGDLVQIGASILDYNREADLKITTGGTTVNVSLSAGTAHLDVPMVEAGSSVEAVNRENTLFMAQFNRKALLGVIRHMKFFDADNTQTASVNFSLSGETLTAFCTNHIMIVHQDCGVLACQHGPIWEKVEKESGVCFAVPGILMSVLERSLGSTEAEKCVVTVDTKYLHLMFDAQCIASVRLSASAGNLGKFLPIYASAGSVAFACDKAKFEAALKMIATKLSLSKSVGEGVPVLLTGNKDGLKLSVCDNEVVVATAEGSAEGLDTYFAPDLLRDSLSVADAGNVRVTLVDIRGKQMLVLGNGTVKDGIKKDAAGIIASPVSAESGEKEQSRFASGKSKKDIKDAEKAAAKKSEEASSDEQKTA